MSLRTRIDESGWPREARRSSPWSGSRPGSGSIRWTRSCAATRIRSTRGCARWIRSTAAATPTAGCCRATRTCWRCCATRPSQPTSATSAAVRACAHMRRAGLPDPYADDRGSMLRLDPPDHTRLRGLVAKAFTPRAVERMRPRIEAILKELVEARPARGADGAGDRARRAAAGARDRRDARHPARGPRAFRRWSNERSARARRRRRSTSGVEAQRATEELGEYFDAIAAARRARAARRPDQRARRRPRRRATSCAATSCSPRCTLLLVAGNETTTNLIWNSVLALLRNPDAARAACARDPSGSPTPSRSCCATTARCR